MSSNTESLMRGAMEAEAFAHRLTLLRIESEHRLALYLARFKPAQDAAPAAAVAHAPPTFAAPLLRGSRSPGRPRERARHPSRRRKSRPAIASSIASDFATSGAQG